VAEAAPIDRRALVRDALRSSCLLGALVCAVAALLGSSDLAIGVALGTLLGAVNFVLLARGIGGAIDRTVASVEQATHARGASAEDGLDPVEVVDRPRGAGGPLRLALLVVLVAGVLWLQPADPAGIALGFVLTLIGASVAALRHNRAR
jgi:hypothetical protein